MKSNLASLEISYIVKELQFMIGGKIDKVFQPKKEELILQCHVPNHGKKYLKIVSGKLLYLMSAKEATDKPPGFCMFLRKHLGNSRIREINQLGFERIVEVLLETKDFKYKLIFELFGTGNIILLKDNIILSAIEYKIWKDRAVIAKKEYKYPELPNNFMSISEIELIKMLDSSEKESLVKSLAIDLGLGGTYAEELCLRAKVNKDIIPNKFKKISELFDEIKKLRDLKINASVVESGKDIVPFDLLYYKDKSKEYFETYSMALDKIFSEQKAKQKEKSSVKNKAMGKLDRMIDAQKKNIIKLGKDEILNRKKADVVYANYQVISDIISDLKSIMKKHPFDVIKKKLKGHDVIKEFNAKDKTIVVEFKE